jgi:hypothetical protein
MDCYVYYKTPEKNERFVLEQVSWIQKLLSEQFQGAMLLQRRPEVSDGQHTWMEVYRDVPDAFDHRLTALVEQSDLTSLLHGERHYEYFMDVNSCA